MSKSLSNKKTKRFEDFVETENPQLSLFTLLEDDRDDYSHTILSNCIIFCLVLSLSIRGICIVVLTGYCH